MKICSICSKKIVNRICRRCNRWICGKCHFHHGLCKKCASDLERLR